MYELEVCAPALVICDEDAEVVEVGMAEYRDVAVMEEVEEVRMPPRLRERAVARGSKRRDLTISQVVS